ncbi:FtsX-like permease family protein [Candidatus Falkowbacteria bacterium]|nr:FtsX-like permease family protein [Candidatus Falkowbacteria bacterium]
MLTSDLFQETYTAVTANKARSGLTMLGIVIGIGSVIAMVSIGQGAQSSIESSIQSIGSNLLLISPGAPRGAGGGVNAGRGSVQTLTLDDAEAIKSGVAAIKAVAPDVSRRYQVTAKGKNTNTQIVGTTPAYPSVRNVEVADGSFFNEAQVKSLAKVAVLAPTTRDDLFGEGASVIGQKVRINQVDFKIIGVTKSKGGTGFGNQDDMIFVPISVAQNYLSGNSFVSTISVQSPDADSLATIQQQISGLLLSRHKISNPQQADFQILNQADIVATASSVTGTFTILLAAIAGISLIVGGIGIMNMMLTTVTERTREIGLRKAIGAKRDDISNQFLAESVMLTFIGGLIGVGIGWLASRAVTSFAGINTTISMSSVLLAFGVSAAIGIIFGYYPARRAAKLNPIEALRYE